MKKTYNQNLREKTIKEYYQNPNKCLFCGKIIEVAENKCVSETRKKKFCNLSCSAKFNNKLRKKDKYCLICGTKIDNGKYCQKCKPISFNKKFLELQNKTKGELIRERGYFKARSAITKNARTVYFKNNNITKCKICGYDKYIEVCHIKPVSDFSDDSKISEINNIKNLVGLCPNHHKEFDNNILDLTELKKINII